MTLRPLLSVPLGLLLSGSALVAADKSQYTLWNPTPRAEMRPMNTDRPDLTESAYTVDAGHFQMEMDLVSYFYDANNGLPNDVRVEGYRIAPINLKVGLCNRADFQVVIDTYTHVEGRSRSGTFYRNHGFGDITTRLKVNLWGNDEGDTALALLPFLKLPTNENDLGNNAIEGGMVVPFAWRLPYDWDLGVMSGVNFYSNDGDYHPNFINTITVGHGIVGKLSGYLEFATFVTEEAPENWIGTVDLGLVYPLTPDLQLDAGINLGVTTSATDYNPFAGVSWRF